MVDVNLNGGNFTPLSAACCKRHSHIVISSILIEARINSKDEKYTRYLGAYYNVHLYVVYKMSKAGANIYLNETSFMAAKASH